MIVVVVVEVVVFAVVVVVVVVVIMLVALVVVVCRVVVIVVVVVVENPLQPLLEPYIETLLGKNTALVNLWWDSQVSGAYAVHKTTTTNTTPSTITPTSP